MIDIHQVDAQVGSRATLTRFEQHQGARGEEIDGGGPVAGFDISIGYRPDLLVGFVEFSFFDSVEGKMVLVGLLVGDDDVGLFLLGLLPGEHLLDLGG